MTIERADVEGGHTGSLTSGRGLHHRAAEAQKASAEDARFKFQRYVCAVKQSIHSRQPCYSLRTRFIYALPKMHGFTD